MLSQNQIDNFHNQGYLVVENFCQPETCQALMDRIADIIDENQQTFPNIPFSSGDNSHALHQYFIESANKIHFFLEPKALNSQGEIQVSLDKAINKIGHGLHVKDDVFRLFSHDPRIKTIAHQLGFEQVGLIQSMYIFKQPEIGDAVKWHQDSTYLYVEDSDVIGFWFALEDATIENGCLRAIKGTPPLRQRMIYADERCEFVEENKTEWTSEQHDILEVKRGSLILLHGRLPHTSGPNHSQKSRHAYALHVVDKSKKYSKQNWLQWPQGIPEL